MEKIEKANFIPLLILARVFVYVLGPENRKYIRCPDFLKNRKNLGCPHFYTHFYCTVVTDLRSPEAGQREEKIGNIYCVPSFISRPGDSP